MYRALISHCHIYIRMILNCPRCTQIKLHSWHHSHWNLFIFHVILESYSNLYGTAYPFLSARAHIWVLCDSWCLSLICSICWRVIVCFCRLYVFICILYSSYDFCFTPVLNVSVQTWYIYYWHVHFVFVLWLSFHP